MILAVTAFLTGDVLIMLGHALGSISNGILLLQCLTLNKLTKDVAGQPREKSLEE